MKPVVTEKAIMMIEANNVLTFSIDKRINKDEIKKQVESMFGIKVEAVRTFIRDNKKFAYVKLKPEFQAIDVATKLGMM